MRIDKLEIKNFKKFAEQTIELHPQFNLLVGDNGSGKTTILDALAVALGVWLIEVPDTMLQNSKRNILSKDIRLEPEGRGDRVQFQQRRPVDICATGRIDGWQGSWARRIAATGTKNSKANALEALTVIKSCYQRVERGEEVLCPVLAYYGAGRGWLPSRERSGEKTASDGPARRWAAFYDCFSERIRFAELRKWFLGETAAAGNRDGRIRPGFDVVRRAILACVPGGDGVYFSSDMDQIILSIMGKPQPFDNLSAGQRMMLAMVADIAIKVVTQNAHLLPADELAPEDEPLPRVLRETPGVVLIDELDVHLHPSWQRRVASDLKRTFPAIQFVCTSHSPQVIGELSRDEVQLLRDTDLAHPAVAIGADSNWILNHVMDRAASKNETAKALQQEAEEALAARDFEQSRAALTALRDFMEDGETSELVGLESRLESLETLASEEGPAGA